MPSRTQTLNRRSGFTLVELLVVVAIIGLLIAMLLPALNNAKEVARATTCQSVLHQHGIAAMGYGAEFADHLPFKPQATSTGAPSYDGSGLQGVSWQWIMAPYLGAEKNRATWKDTGSMDATYGKAFYCPSSGITTKRGWGVYCRDGWTLQDGYAGSFHDAYKGSWPGETANHSSPNGPFAAAGRLTFNYFAQPGSTPFRYCSDTKMPGGVCGNDLFNQHASWHMRHTDNWIRPTLFVDGHAKALTDRRYTDAPAAGGDVGHDIGGHGSERQMKDGVYNTYELSSGNAYGGNPAHNPYDFWIDEN